MKLLNGEIYEAWGALGELMGKELPVKTSLDLAILQSKLKEPYNTIENVKAGLIRKYGAKDKDDPQKVGLQPSDKNWAKFVPEFNELMGQTTEVVFNIVELPQEVDGKKFQVKPEILVSLVKFVKVG